VHGLNVSLSLRLPASLHKQAIGTALAEKLAALATEEYLQQRGRRASRRKFDAALLRVPDVAADPHDER
jgi:hypothetical protein